MFALHPTCTIFANKKLHLQPEYLHQNFETIFYVEHER